MNVRICLPWLALGAILWPVSAHAKQIVPGVDHKVVDRGGLDVHIIEIDRSLKGYELRVLGVHDGNGTLLTRRVKDLADTNEAIVAINGYAWSGPDGDSENQVVTPDSTTMIDGVEIRDCYSDAKVDCQFDHRIISFPGGANINMFTSPEFEAAEKALFHRQVLGSDFRTLIDGECFDYEPPVAFDARTAIGFSEDSVFLLSSNSIGLATQGLTNHDLCEIMLEEGATDALMLDGGSASGMVINHEDYDGDYVNPLKFPYNSDALGGYPNGRYVANAIGLVKTDECSDPLVSIVAPDTAKIGQKTTFGIHGECLPDTTAFWIENCADVETLYITSNNAEFTCTPMGEPGIRQGVVKDKPMGNELKAFSVEFVTEGGGGTCPNGDGLYCGGPLGLDPDTLYQCTDGNYAVSQVCVDGCVNAGAGNDDYCAAGGEPCPSGDGLYCGESVGKTPSVLYSCNDGVYSVSMVCDEGCIDAGDGNNDYCKNEPCGCDGGVCCDGCFYRPANYVCDNNAVYMYDCIGGGCGADVSISYRDRYCSGFSTSCDGDLGPWSGEEVYDVCSTDETCTPGDNSCNPEQMCSCDYDLEPEAPASSYDAPYSCPGGIVMPISGSIDPDTGKLTVLSPSKPGGFGAGTYRVVVFDPYVELSKQCKENNVDKATKVLVDTEQTLTFPAFDSLLMCGGEEKAYCIIKEAGNDEAHFCSGRLVANYQ